MFDEIKCLNSISFLFCTTYTQRCVRSLAQCASGCTLTCVRSLAQCASGCTLTCVRSLAQCASGCTLRCVRSLAQCASGCTLRCVRHIFTAACGTVYHKLKHKRNMRRQICFYLLIVNNFQWIWTERCCTVVTVTCCVGSCDCHMLCWQLWPSRVVCPVVTVKCCVPSCKRHGLSV